MPAVFSAREVSAAAGGDLVRGDGATLATGVSTDTRTLETGELFIALRGPRFDGHKFLLQAMERKAAGVVVERGSGVPGADATFVIEVGDTLRALGDIARWHRSRFKISVVGVTGSNGKTTAKEMIAAILSTKGETCKSQGNLNNLVGLPHQVLRLSEKHAHAVFEMGMSQAGEIRRMTEIARPQIAIITNIGPAHIEGLGSMEAVSDAKGEILKAMPTGGVAILSNEDAYSRALAERREAAGERVVRFGFSAESRVWSDAVHITAEGTYFTLKYPDGERDVQLKAIGRHNVLNALAAAGCAFVLGVGPDEIAIGLSLADLPEMRLQARDIPGRAGVYLLDDSYNANPASVFEALEAVSALRGEGRFICILGDMAELGGIAESAHRKVGHKVTDCGADLFVSVGPLMRLASEEARRSGMEDSQLMCFDALDEVASFVAEILRPGDWVLVKGSRSMRMERVIKGLEI